MSTRSLGGSHFGFVVVTAVVVDTAVVVVETVVVTVLEEALALSEDVETFFPPQPVNRHSAAERITIYFSFRKLIF